ncbi:hypothetical protein JB92DRAFT_2713200 [Gautieria morchelliformis]|nr:hypothetical protein JB92DRAFT_2713200 [Gautieria morchelliformis]
MKTNNFLVCALCASLAHAEASPKLYHRIWDPYTPPQPFSLRATVQNSQESGLVLIAADNVDQLILDPDHPEGSLYQVALQRDGDLTENDWDISSVKACHVAGIKSDIVKLHLSSSETVYAIDYFVHPVPRDGSCPKKKPASRTSISFTNTTLIIGTAGKAPLPELRAPPQLSPQGEPVQPQPEQSFIQKYWMYIAMGLITLGSSQLGSFGAVIQSLIRLLTVLTGGAAPDEEQGGQGGQSQGRGSGGRAAGR